MADVFPLGGALLFAVGVWLIHERDERRWRRQADERKRSGTPAE